MAMELGTAIAAEVAKESGKAALRQLVDYCFHFNRLVEELGKEKKRLTEHKQSVDEDVKIAQEKDENIVVLVQSWLADAKALIEKADLLEEKAKQGSCLEGWPWIWRYRLGKRIAKLIGEIKDQIRGRIELGPVGRIKTLEGMRYHQPQNFQFFNCTKSAYNDLLEALKDDEKHKIGLWGMGGSGKTTLVKQLGFAAQALMPKLFDKVAFVVVSSNVDVRKIQGEIADQIGLKMEEEYESGRAQRLSMRLKQGQKILIILDDLWKEIPLREIGIPIGEDCNSCKVLLTTRKQGVCNLMDCQKTVSLGLLDEAEAWRLFQIHAGISDDSAGAWNLDLGEKISKKCGGLPVAIVALSRSLKGKPKVRWDDSLSAIENSEQVHIPESFRENENPYKCLRLSYDNLEDENARSLFLLCSLFPEDSKIYNEDLVRHAFGLSRFENVNSCKRMRTMVDTAIDTLIDSCLLLLAEDGQSVQMHDWVRDVALSIAEKQIQSVMKPDDLKALVGQTDAKDTVTKLYCSGINEFPDQLACPNLEILYAHLFGRAKLPDAFFVRVKGLKVLTLNLGTRPLLSQSIQELTSLRSLCLRSCSMKDLCFLRQMNKLILLDISDCEVEGNPFEVLAGCSQLQELYFMKNVILVKNKLDDRKVAEWFHRAAWFSTLQRYHLDVSSKTSGTYFRADDIRLRSRLFCMVRFDASAANTGAKDLMERAELLVLDTIKEGCKNIIPDTRVAMNELNELWIVASDQIECLVDNTTLSGQVGIAAFSKLIKLRIMFMESMKATCRGPPPHALFEKLEFLEIKSCLKWRFLFTDVVAKGLIMLAELRIENCNALQRLIGDDNEEEEIVSADGRLVFPKLKLLHVYRCHKLEYLIPVYYTEGLQHLEDLSINWADSLRYIFGESNLQNQNEFHIIDLPALKRLHLEYLPSIRSICPTNYCPKWPLLDKLDLRNCQPRLHDFMPIDIFVAGSLWQQSTVTKHLREAAATLVQNLESLNILFSKVEGIFSLQDEPPVPGQVHTRLIELSLTYFTELRYIWLSANYVLNLQKLKKVQIDGCEKLKAIFPSNVLRSLPQLKEVLLRDCNELEQMVEKEKENQNVVNPQEPRYILMGAHYDMDLQNLQVLKIEGCGKLNAVFSASTLGGLQQLKELWIINCENLVHITEEEGENQNLSLSHSGQVRFPQLTTLVVHGCHKLKGVFSLYTSQELPKLRNLLIVEASELEEVFRRQQGDIEEQVGDLLPELKILILVELENLTHVCQGFQLQTVNYSFVHHCSNLSLAPPATQPSLNDLADKAYRDGQMILSDLIRGVEYKIRPGIIFPTMESIEPEWEAAFNEDSETRERIHEDTNHEVPSSQAGLMAQSLSNSHFAEASEARARARDLETKVNELEIELAESKAELETFRSSIEDIIARVVNDARQGWVKLDTLEPMQEACFENGVYATLQACLERDPNFNADEIHQVIFGSGA